MQTLNQPSDQYHKQTHMNKLSQFFQDDNDRFSATRLAFLSWIFGVLIIWGVGSFHDKKMQDIPSSIQVLIGVLMTGKVVQKFSEVSGSTATADKPAPKMILMDKEEVLKGVKS